MAFDVDSLPMVVVVPMRLFKTRSGKQAHLSIGPPSRTLCGSGCAVGEPLKSDEVGHYAGYLHEGRIRMCLSCAQLAKRAKNIHERRRCREAGRGAGEG